MTRLTSSPTATTVKDHDIIVITANSLKWPDHTITDRDCVELEEQAAGSVVVEYNL